MISGSKYYYYGTPKNGYKMSSCTKDSPCSGTMGNSETIKTLSTTPIYTVTIKKSLDGGTATTVRTVNVASNESYSAEISGGLITFLNLLAVLTVKQQPLKRSIHPPPKMLIAHLV